MKRNKLYLFFIAVCVLSSNVTGLIAQVSVNYLNESVENYGKRMEWFDQAKYGLFIHYGLYSSLGGEYQNQPVEGYAEWIQSTADIATVDYEKFIEKWNPKKFDADFIVKLAKKAGMKYVVITTKHHEGFCLWNSDYTSFDIGGTRFPKRDILRELSNACRKYGLKFGTYYSIIDWHHPSQERNSAGKDSWGRWAQIKMKKGQKASYVQYMKNQIKELIDRYDTDILWFDADWVDWWTLEDGQDLYQYIRELKPSILINNRVAKRSQFKKDFGTPEQEHPDKVQDHHWEACYTLNDSWGYKINDHHWKTPQEVFDKLKDINGKGGNLILNLGPDGKGQIPQPSIKVLKEVGQMLKHRSSH